MLVALMVPIAAASNSTVLRCSRTYDGAGANEIPAVLTGAVISTLVALLLLWPLVATRRDKLPVGAWAGCNWRLLACVLAVLTSPTNSGVVAALSVRDGLWYFAGLMALAKCRAPTCFGADHWCLARWWSISCWGGTAVD